MINRIEIQGFKSIQKMDLKLSSINILIGANGAGKSNFINFFKLLYQLYHQDLQNYVAEEAGAENILHLGLKYTEKLFGRIEFDSTNAYLFTLATNQQGSLYFQHESTQFHHGFPSWDEVALGKGYLESKLKYTEGARYRYVNTYMSSFRVFHFHDTSKTAKIKQKGSINDNRVLREDGGNLAAYLFYLQETSPRDFRKIENVIRTVAPYFEGFDLQPDKIRNDQIQLAWKQKGSDMTFFAMHLSDGTLRFMTLATLLLQPNLPKTIIIDEPELGLHPFAINKLAGLIKKASAQSQVIVSTQSTDLVDNFAPEDVIIVDRNQTDSAFKRLESSSLQNWLKNYTLGNLWHKNVIGGTP
ncbi:AAA family ATPase [Flectobacillus sp. BAB-3569]|uniref:AAA family ATPase n=1 Tax=Flectobacillus sp. BAB-3569 TaxID=1509483 RepID=UPI000BA464B0|nr:AAA family ATPase [Flectobacillus sp. BAB-3569]PAC33239.1 ATPase [Flectobacillus sp. BAB-3569]